MRFQTTTILLAAGLACGVASAQDSVSATPGAGDALSAYDAQQVDYVLDLAPIMSSWGNGFAVAPLLKASADPDPLFATQVTGAVAVSADQRLSASMPVTSFAEWSSAGPGVNAAANTAPGALSVTTVDRRFAVSLNDFNGETSNVITAIVGQNASDPTRLYVSRIVAAASRGNATAADTATISLGAVDADGLTHLRVDDFNVNAQNDVDGENIFRVDAPGRNASVNRFTSLGADDAAATAAVVTEDPVTLNTPVARPTSLGGAATLLFDFALEYRVDGDAGVTSHVMSPAVEHRGNPSFIATPLLGVGNASVAGLAASQSGGALADTLFIFDIDASNAPVATDAAELPTPISDGAFTANATGEAQFHHYLSQLCFRGPNGPVAGSLVGGDVLLAATALDPAAGEFVAIVTMTGAGQSWSVPIHDGASVLNGPSGAVIGTINAAVNGSLSSPAMDDLGNVYVVASWTPNGGDPGRALLKAVYDGADWSLEKVLATGDAVAGVNSATNWTVEELVLDDADSVASGSLASASVLRPALPGAGSTDPASPAAFGGLIVNAVVTYDNAGTPETYDAALFVGPDLTPVGVCEGDADGDNQVDFDDLNLLLSQWGTTGPEGDVAPHPTGDGSVDFNDLNLVLARWGAACP
ncbi:MAG: GC-type dockerin domain-anchored protein [Phycisphaerales bacterium]